MNLRRWIGPGLVVTVFIALIAVVAGRGPVERDLFARVAARLAADGQTWASVDVSARTVAIRGTAPSAESAQLAVDVIGGVRGVRQVVDRTDLLPLASPYVWSARREGRAVTLAGAVPSEGQRASVLAAARRAVPEAEIVDGMQLARGAAAAFNGATTFALARLADLAVGVATLTDATLTVSGTAVSAAAYANARAAFAEAVPAAVTLGPVDILPARADPFVWSANFDENAVTLAGFVPNEIVREALAATIKAGLADLPIVDDVTIASGEPSTFTDAATFAIAALVHLRSGGITLDGLRLNIAGEAKSVDDYEALLATLTGSLPEGMQVVAADVIPAPATPYGWRGEIADGTVVLSGYVPSAERRAELAELAQNLYAGATIDNRVRVAAGEPRMDWIGAIKFAMGELAQLSRGAVVLGDKTYAIEGEAASSDAYVAIIDANTQTLPASLELAGAEIVPPLVPQYRFVAERRGGGLALSGHVSATDQREAILAAAKRSFGAIEVSDDLAFAGGAPPGFGDAASMAVRALGRLAGGRVEIAGQSVAVSGVAFHRAAVEEVREAIAAALPEGFTMADFSVIAAQEGQPVSPDRCRQILQAVLQAGRIEFDDGQANIAADSYGVLDRAASAIVRCPRADIEIAAHADSDGSAARNRDLTQARAEAIADLLVGAGVKRERLAAVGYGESEPIADNSTEAGKAQNRRIEFVVAVREDR